MVLTAAQSAYDPAEHDDGYGHSYETGSHPLEICKKKGTAENTLYVGGRAQFFYINSSD